MMANRKQKKKWKGEGNRIIVIILLLISFACIFVPINGKDRIKGGFQKAYLYIYLYKNGEWDTAGNKPVNIYSYDENGNWTGWDKPRDNGCFSKYKIRYDSHGNKTESAYYNFRDSLCKKEYQMKYYYDARGNIVEEAFFFPGGKLYYGNIYKYDSNGFQFGSMQYDGNGNVLNKSYSKNKDTNSNEECVGYYHGGFEPSRSIFKKDKNGKKTELYHYDSTGLGCLEKEIRYNHYGNIIEEINYTSIGSVKDRKVYNYYDSGLLNELICYHKGECITKWQKYDINGNIIEETDYNYDCSFNHKKAYEYDEFGNKTAEIDYQLPDLPYKKTVYIYSK